MGCCACCCEAGENPGTCCGDTCCRSPDTCCGETQCCRLSDCKVCVEVSEGVFNCVSACDAGECCVGGLCVPNCCDPPCGGCMECVAGECVSSCADGEYCCNGTCQASPCDPPCAPPCDECSDCIDGECVSSCASGELCCQGACKPTCQACCCTDGVATEVSDPADCQGTLLDKPASQQSPDVIVEWCGLTLTAKCETPYIFSASEQSLGVRCTKALDIGFGDQEFQYRDPYLSIVLSFSNCFGACNLYDLQMDVQTVNQGFVFRTEDDFYLGAEVTLKSYKASQSSCDEGLTMTLDAENSTTTNWCGGSGHVVCNEDPVVTVTMAP